MIQVHGKIILSMEFNPILKAHGSRPWQLLIKAHGKSHGNNLHKHTSYHSRPTSKKWRTLHENFLNPSQIMPTFCYITIQPTSIATWWIFAEKCSHEELRITLATLHKKKSNPSLTWIHPAILWHYSKLPTTVSSHHTIYLVAAKV